MRISPKTLPQLIEDMTACREIAKQAISGLSDGGTCNLDSPKLLGPKSINPAVEKILEEAGFSVFTDRQGAVINIGVGGQGHTRTKAAETFMKAMRERGYEMSMYYQMD